MQLSGRCGAIAKPPIWADFYTVENRPTAEQPVSVLEVVEPLACGLVPDVDQEAVGLQLACRPDVLVGRPECADQRSAAVASGAAGLRPCFQLGEPRAKCAVGKVAGGTVTSHGHGP
jgi:hypothetical protein